MKNFSLFIEEGFIEYLREKHSDFLPKIYKFEFEISVCCGEFLNSSSGYEKKLSVYFRKACEFWYETRVFRIFGGEFVRWNIKKSSAFATRKTEKRKGRFPWIFSVMFSLFGSFSRLGRRVYRVFLICYFVFCLYFAVYRNGFFRHGVDIRDDFLLMVRVFLVVKKIFFCVEKYG